MAQLFERETSVICPLCGERNLKATFMDAEHDNCILEIGCGECIPVDCHAFEDMFNAEIAAVEQEIFGEAEDDPS